MDHLCRKKPVDKILEHENMYPGHVNRKRRTLRNDLPFSVDFIQEHEQELQKHERRERQHMFRPKRGIQERQVNQKQCQQKQTVIETRIDEHDCIHA